VGGVDLGRRHEQLEVEVRVEVRVVGGRVAQEALDVILQRLARHAGHRPDVAGGLGPSPDRRRRRRPRSP
jgi:hypothetical protein